MLPWARLQPSATRLVKGEVGPAGTGVSLPAALTLGVEGPKLMRGDAYMCRSTENKPDEQKELAACKTLGITQGLRFVCKLKARLQAAAAPRQLFLIQFARRLRQLY